MNKMIIENLKSIYSSRKSFYNKAKIKKDKNNLILISYTSEILKLNLKTKKLKRLYNQDFSVTTTRHINEFLKQFYNNELNYNKKLISELLGG